MSISYEIKKLIPDKMYICMQYYKHFHNFPNLKNPKTFNEKLQWLKLHDRNPDYVKMVDKYEVRKYIAENIGEKYLIPMYGVWDRAEDIDFDSLPDQFVLKCTHDSGSVVICKDKASIDKVEVTKKLSKALKKNAFYYGREWPYKNVKPRIIAEQYMTDNGNELTDYKIHNFNGVPKVILVCRDRFAASGLTEDFYSASWEYLDVKRPNCPNAQSAVNKPYELDEMLEVSRILSKDIPFVRSDFYTIDHKVYFGELTFYPASGMGRFEPKEWDTILSDWIKLPI